MIGTYTIEEISSKAKLTPQAIRKLCRDGIIKSEKIGGIWLANQESADTFLLNYKNMPTLDKPNTDFFIHKKPVVLSFFSGAMGLDTGLEKAGFEILLACEIDKASRKTILKNKPNIALIGDINEYSYENIRTAAGLTETEDIDLIVGGPPCQAFSTAGKRQGFNDERGNVLLTFIDRIIKLNPKFAVIENVRGLLSAPLSHRENNKKGFGYPPLTPTEEKGGALLQIIEQLRNAGYGVSFNLYNSANFGTPQKRERVIIVCSRDGKKPPHLQPTHSEDGDFGLPRWRTFYDAVHDIQSMHHNHLNFPNKRLQYYKLLGPGQYWKDLPLDIQKIALGNSFYAGGGKTGFFRRLAWDKPSPTLVTHPAMPATDLAHPELDRPLSIEEYKRIQEFEDNWEIEGTLLEKYKQIGNAVPSSLGYAVGRLIINMMNKEEIKNPQNFPYSRYKNTDEESWYQMVSKNMRLS